MVTLGANRKRKFYELASTFLLDASVLIFIFVPLDVLIQFGRTGITFSILVASWAAAALFFAVAYIMAVAGEET